MSSSSSSSSSSRDERTHQPPVPRGPLPELDPAERRMVLRMARMVKADQLWEYDVRLHEDRGRLQLNWKEGGGACLAT